VTFSKSTSAQRRVLALLALIGLACASGGSSGDGAASPDGVDCGSLTACDDNQQCGNGAQCFKIKSCPGFVCADVKTACEFECGSRDCLVLESHPMMIGCR